MNSNKSHLDIVFLEEQLNSIDSRHDHPYVYVETGKYKPYSVATVRAAARRGHVVEKVMDGVYRVSTKAKVLE